MQTAPTKKFFEGLEALRGIAALTVVFLHIEVIYFRDQWANPANDRLLFHFFRNGYLMVDLFFVLSGFVICHNYFSKISCLRDVLRFMFLRFGRLYPLHLFFLLIFFGMEIVKYIGQQRFGFVANQHPAFTENGSFAFVANIFLVQPFFPSANLSFNAPSWSIGIEFYTYLIFATVVLIAPGKTKTSIFAGFLISFSILLLIVAFHSRGVTDD